MEKTRKLSDEEMEKLDPIIEQILDEIKDVPPSRQDEILKAAQRFVEICQRNNVSTESQAKLIELYRKVVVALVKSEKADMQSQQKIKNRRRVLGL